MKPKLREKSTGWLLHTVVALSLSGLGAASLLQPAVPESGPEGADPDGVGIRKQPGVAVYRNGEVLRIEAIADRDASGSDDGIARTASEASDTARCLREIRQALEARRANSPDRPADSELVGAILRLVRAVSAEPGGAEILLALGDRPDRDPSLASLAIRALARSDDPEVLAALRGLIEDEGVPGVVRLAALRALFQPDVALHSLELEEIALPRVVLDDRVWMRGPHVRPGADLGVARRLAGEEGNPALRVAAMEILWDAGETAGVFAALTSLRGDSGREALEAFLFTRGRSILAQPDVTRSVLDWLGSVEPSHAVPALVAWLRPETDWIETFAQRRGTAYHFRIDLDRHCEPGAADAVLSALLAEPLTARPLWIRVSVVETLAGRLAEKSVTRYLAEAIEGSPGASRGRYVHALLAGAGQGQFEFGALEGVLGEMAAASEDSVASALALGLLARSSRLGAETVRVARRSLDDPNPEIRRAAVSLFAREGRGSELVARFSQLLREDPSMAVRVESARAIVAASPSFTRESREVLDAFWGATDPREKEGLLLALAPLADQVEVGSTVRSILDSSGSPPGLAATAIRILSEHGTSEDLARFVEWMRLHHEGKRRLASDVVAALDVGGHELVHRLHGDQHVHPEAHEHPHARGEAHEDHHAHGEARE